MHEFAAILKDAIRFHKKEQGQRHEHRRTKIESSDGNVLVVFSNGRKQKISVESTGIHYVLSSVVIGSTRVANEGKATILTSAWKRNRHTNVVNFTLDRKERLVGQIEVLHDHLQPSELIFYIELLARECDRFEYLLIRHDEQ